MKIIEFPTRKKTLETPKQCSSATGENTAMGELIDLANSEVSLSKDKLLGEVVDFDLDETLFEKIARTAAELSTDEDDMAAAICAIVDELNKKTAPLREKVFLPNKAFFSMVENEVFEQTFQRIISSFPAMSSYKEITLSQMSVMLDKSWPFKADQKQIINFTLHIMGAYPSIDLLKLKAYISENDWHAALNALEHERL
jgi:hypothetical protein